MSDPGIPMSPHPLGRRRVALALAALGIAAAGCSGAPGLPGGGERLRSSELRIMSSSVDLGGGLGCTVSAPADVHPGGPIGVRFTHQNHGTEPVEVDRHDAEAYGVQTSFELRALDGREYDTAQQHRRLFISGPRVEPIVLEPGESYTSGPSSLAVRWGGPLTISPRCSGKHVSQLTINVTQPGDTPSVDEALRRAAEQAQIFDDCMPPADGSSIVGSISPPDGGPFEPLPARCWAEVRPYRGFTTVAFAILSPPARPAVPLTEHWFELPLPKDKPAETMQWWFVVTGSATMSVEGPVAAAAAPPGVRMIDYLHESDEWDHSAAGCEGGGLAYGSPLYFFAPENCADTPGLKGIARPADVR